MKDDNYNIVEKILIPHTAMEYAVKRIGQCFRASHSSSEPICIALIGPSRTGKSRVLEFVEKRYPRLRLNEGLRVPILNVKTPSNPTTKGLAGAMLRAIGDPNPRKGTEASMTDRLVTLLDVSKTKMLMVDEFQHFYDKKSQKVMHHVADWLKLMVDESKVALVVSGLASCQAVLNQNEQLAGRFSSSISMPRFNWLDDNDRNEFSAILGAFQEALEMFDMPDLANDQMAFRFYCASGGLIGYVAKILRQAIWNAIDDESNSISLEDLSIAHKMSVYADEKSYDLPLPFNRDFSMLITTPLLERVGAIGTPSLIELPKRGRRSEMPVQKTSSVFQKPKTGMPY